MTTGDMADGDHVTFTVEAEPEVTDTDNGDALRTEVTFRESSHDFETIDGIPFEDGMSVVLLTWSKRLGRALQRAAGQADGDLRGETVRLDKSGSGYDVDYSAALVDPEN